MRATAEAPSNVAVIKYWGRKNEELRLPANGSISINLSGLRTTTTVEFSQELEKDRVVIDGKVEENEGYDKVVKHLDQVRDISGKRLFAHVESKNSFPRSTGLSSSASGFAALTVAATHAIGLELSEKELSILARQGSGSACRSIPDGWVEWLDGETSDESYAVTIFPPDHWDLIDVVCIFSTQPKKIPTSEGQKSAHTSPNFAPRIKDMPRRIAEMKKIIAERDFAAFGDLVEKEALDLHEIMETSVPPLYYMTQETREMIERVRGWRDDGLAVYFTVNTGENIHLICESENKDKLLEALEDVEGIKEKIVNHPSGGASLSEKHLF